jgi:hypothetical protein
MGPITGTGDDQHVRIVREPIETSGGEERIGKPTRPLARCAIARD